MEVSGEVHALHTSLEWKAKWAAESVWTFGGENLLPVPEIKVWIIWHIA
jgi:hypothetical protein